MCDMSESVNPAYQNQVERGGAYMSLGPIDLVREISLPPCMLSYVVTLQPALPRARMILPLAILQSP